MTFTVSQPGHVAEHNLLASQFTDAARYGAEGDGSTDDTAALQAAITATPVGGTLVLRHGTYIISEPLIINKHMTIRGAGMHEAYTAVSGGLGGTDGPTQSPYIVGTVIEQTTAATNGLNLTGSGKCVNLYDFGIRFASDIQFDDTGHGIYAVSDGTYLTGHDSGVMGSTWERVGVWGHDGDHYAYYMVNPILSTFNHLRSWGGGGMYIYCDSAYTNYGNLHITHPYVLLFCAGTAHGFHLNTLNTGMGTGTLNLIKFDRPQCNGTDNRGFFPSTTPPTTDQHLFLTTNTPLWIQVDAPNFESALDSPVVFGTHTMVTGHGLISGEYDPYFTAQNIAGTRKVSASLQRATGTGTAPTITVGAGTGTGASISGQSGDDFAGRFTLNVGSGPPGNDVLARVTFAELTAAPKVVSVQPLSGAATLLGHIYVSTITSTYFEIRSSINPTGSGNYNLGYVVTI